MTRAGSTKTYAVTAAQGGRRRAYRRALLQQAQPQATAPAAADLMLAFDFQLTTADAVQHMLTLESNHTRIDLAPAMVAVVQISLPPSVGFLATTITALTPPAESPASGLPATSSSITLWATSAFSPRYAAGSRAPGVPLAAEKAVGGPQLLTARTTRCTASLASAWQPTMQRPRLLETYHNASSVARVNVSQVAAVVVAVPFLGSVPSPLLSIDLLVAPAGARASSPLTEVNIYTLKAGDAKPGCPALNAYALPAGLGAGPQAGMVVVGVRLKPSQARVANKGHLMQVRHL